MTPVHQLPTLAELRSRRTEAVRIAGRRLLPRLIVTAAAVVPSLGAVIAVQRGLLDPAVIVPVVGLVGIVGMAWIGIVMLDYIRRVLPDELRKAGLVCHVCGKPLAPKTSGNAASIRVQTKDPDILAALDGKCAWCGAWVVRDGAAQGALNAGTPDYQPTRNSSRARA